MKTSSDESLAIEELAAAFTASNKLARTAPSDDELRAAVTRLLALAEMNCSGSDDLLRVLPAVVGRRGLMYSSLDSENSLALLQVIHGALAGGRGSVLCQLERLLPDKEL